MGKTKFMPDNDKREMLFFFFFFSWENKLGKWTGNTNKAGNNISKQNKLDMLFQHSWEIGRPNHSMMEYSLLSQCNHKARLDGLMTCRLAWHPWSDSRSQIIFWRYDSIHRELFEIELNNARQIRLFTFQFLERFWQMTSARAIKMVLI